MPTVHATSSPLPVAPTTMPSANTRAAGSLLPEASTDGMDDAMMTVDLLMAKQQSYDMQSGEKGAQIDKTARDRALAAQKAAIQKELDNSASHGTGFFGSIAKVVKDASSDLVHGHIADALSDTAADVKSAVDSPKFWSDLEVGAKFVAEVAGVVAGAAATIATAGTAGPLVVGVAIALSAGGFAVSETRCLDGVLGKGVSQYVGLGLDLAGAAVTFGATLATPATTAATTAASTAASGTAGAVSGASRGASLIGKVAAATSGVADIVAGAANVKNADFAANVADAEGDETSAKDTAAKQERFTKWLLDNLSASQQAERDAMQTLQGAVQQHDAGTTAASSFTTRG